ncbi:hypothetical protein C8R46DRAFT_1037854 [Mycena filopes]|nr:hypothetical protein C8R46DRAFT_1037854 [Mycena filopes]
MSRRAGRPAYLGSGFLELVGRCRLPPREDFSLSAKNFDREIGNVRETIAALGARQSPATSTARRTTRRSRRGRWITTPLRARIRSLKIRSLSRSFSPRSRSKSWWWRLQGRSYAQIEPSCSFVGRAGFAATARLLIIVLNDGFLVRSAATPPNDRHVAAR